MKRFTNNPVTVTCLFLCLCAAALVAFATAHAEPPVNTIQACYNDTNGGLRRVNSAADCRTHETPISWNIAGPAGPQGPAGGQGPGGPQGPAGPGAKGVNFRHTPPAANNRWPFHKLTFIYQPPTKCRATSII